MTILTILQLWIVECRVIFRVLEVKRENSLLTFNDIFNEFSTKLFDDFVCEL